MAEFSGDTSHLSVPADITFDTLIVDISFHPTKDVIAAGTIDGEVYLCSVSSATENRELMSLTHHKKACRGLKFSSDGEQLYTVSKDKSLRIVDLNVGGVLQSIKKAHSCPIYSLEVIDQYLLATGDDDGTVKVWDFRREKAIMEIKQMEEYVSSLNIANDKRILVATSGEGTLSAFNVRARRLELQSELFDAEFLCSAFLKHDTKVVVGTGDGVLNIFNFGEWGNISDRFPGHPQSIDCLIPVTEDILCSGSLDGNIRAISILPNRFVGVVGQHGEFPIEALTLSKDAKLLASCSHDQKIKFWNVEFLQDVEVSDKKKAKKSLKRKLLKSAKDTDFFADLES